MTGSWGSVPTALVPLGLVIALSPITVIPAVLVLQAPRRRPSGLAFLAGWLVGLAALTALSVAASGLLCVSAGLAIGTSGLALIGDWIAAACFVVVAASTVAIPILAYAVAGRRLDDTLARLKTWMDENNAALLAAVLVVIGLMLLHNGVHDL